MSHLNQSHFAQRVLSIGIKRCLPLALGVFLLCSACNSGVQDYAYPTFPRNEKLTGEILQEDLAMNPPLDIFCTERYVVMLSLRDNLLLHFFDKETGKYVGSQLNYGRGANEFLRCDNFNYDPKKHIVSFNNATKQTLTRFVLTDSATCCNFETVRREGGEPKYHTIFAMPDNGYLVAQAPIDGEAWLQRFDSTGRLIGTCTKALTDPLERNSSDGQSWAALSPDSKHYARISTYGCILQIYDIERECITEKFTGRYIRPIGKVEEPYGFRFMPEETIMGACDLYATNDYLVAPMLNSCKDSVSTIVVWNWDGDPIAQFETGHLVAKLCIDPCDPTRIYTFSVVNEEFVLEKFCVKL